MKSKKTIGLLILVIAIWGTIGYQAYEQLFSEEPLVDMPVRRKIVTVADTSDRFQLSLDYPDPFLKTTTQASSAASTEVRTTRKVNPTPVITTPHEVPIDAWDRFQYIGSIYNGSRKLYLAMIKINGVEYTPREGEIVGEFKIVNIERDSVEVEYGTVKKVFRKKKDI